jgi:hypothetical protein
LIIFPIFSLLPAGFSKLPHELQNLLPFLRAGYHKSLFDPISKQAVSLSGRKTFDGKSFPEDMGHGDESDGNEFRRGPGRSGGRKLAVEARK